MKVQNTLYILLKSIIYVIVAALLFILNSPALEIVIGILFLISGVLSLLYGMANKHISVVEKRNYAIAIVDIAFAFLLFFTNSFFYDVQSILAIFLVVLALFQMSVTILSGLSDVKTSFLSSFIRFATPLFTVLPAGLIIGNYFDNQFGQNGNNVALAILFLAAAFLNFQFIKKQGEITYTEQTENE